MSPAFGTETTFVAGTVAIGTSGTTFRTVGTTSVGTTFGTVSQARISVGGSLPISIKKLGFSIFSKIDDRRV